MPFASPRSDELEDLRPRTSEGAGEAARFKLAVLELRRRVWGRGDEGVRAFGSLGEAGPGEGSCRLLVLVCSERRLTERGTEFGSLLTCLAPRGVLSLPTPGKGDCGWLCIAAGSQRVAARDCWRVNVMVGCFSVVETVSWTMTLDAVRGPVCAHGNLHFVPSDMHLRPFAIKSRLR